MNTQPAGQKDARINDGRLNLRRRIVAAILLVALTIVAPAIAAAAPLPHRNLRVPLLDRRAIENLQRWVSEGHDREFKGARLAASVEMRRFAPDFAATFEQKLPHSQSFYSSRDIINAYSRVPKAKIAPIAFSRLLFSVPPSGIPYCLHADSLAR